MLSVAVQHEHLLLSGCLHSLGFVSGAADAARQLVKCHHDVFRLLRSHVLCDAITGRPSVSTDGR